MGCFSSKSPSDPVLVVHPNTNRSQNIGALFNNDLFSDLVLIVCDKRFKVHKSILAIQSEYFRTLLTNGMSETSKREISIEESNVELFEKLLRYVYSSELEFYGTNETIEMLLMTNKYLFVDLQNSIATHLEMILATKNFCSIFSVAFACSTSDLMAKCLGMADSKPSEILKADGISNLSVLALNEIISRKSFKSSQAELFDAISKWIAANPNKDAIQLLSNVRLEEMPMGFLLNTVRQSKLFDESRILDAASVVFEKGPKEGKDGKPATSAPVRFTVDIQPAESPNLRLNLTAEPAVYATATIARIKQRVLEHYNCKMSDTFHSISFGSISLYHQDTLLQDDWALEANGIRNGTHLIARCK